MADLENGTGEHLDAELETAGGQGSEGADAGNKTGGESKETLTLEEIGARARAASATPNEAAATQAGGKAGANADKASAAGGDKAAASSAHASGLPETVTFKSHGKDKSIPRDKALEILSSYEGYLPEREKLKKHYEGEVERITAPYRELDAAAEKNPAVAKAAKVLAKHPSTAALFFKALDSEIKAGKLHPDSLKAERLEMEGHVRKVENDSASQAERVTKGNQLLDEHLGEISTKHGEAVTRESPLFKELLEVMKATGIRDIRDAYDYKLLKSGDYDKRLLEKHAKGNETRERIAKGQGARGGSGGANGAAKSSHADVTAAMESIGARAKRAVAAS